MDKVTFFWLIMGGVLLLGEIAVPGFILFFFGVGAFLTLGTVTLLPFLDNYFWLQLIIWVTYSTILLFFLRNRFSGTFKGRIFQTEKEDWIGREAQVIDRIDPDSPGRIKFRGTTWTAHANRTIEAGKTVKIVEKSQSESLGFIVREVKILPERSTK
ncbi:MAG: NfeD family protein [Spirochaetales bacterium]|nr:NfeD family protein [Spirochaetales bacterium]